MQFEERDLVSVITKFHMGPKIVWHIDVTG